jgi:hypothetical protein
LVKREVMIVNVDVIEGGYLAYARHGYAVISQMVGCGEASVVDLQVAELRQKSAELRFDPL